MSPARRTSGGTKLQRPCASIINPAIRRQVASEKTASGSPGTERRVFHCVKSSNGSHFRQKKHTRRSFADTTGFDVQSGSTSLQRAFRSKGPALCQPGASLSPRFPGRRRGQGRGVPTHDVAGNFVHQRIGTIVAGRRIAGLCFTEP